MVDRDTQLSRLDLNLLVSLDALVSERSVTRAAERLGLSQPALSASLARLRVHFDDEILTRQGNTYQLTALALRLAEHSAVALDAARRVFTTQAQWNPEEATREFVVYGSDYGFTTTGHVAAQLAAERAPGVRLRFVAHSPQIVQDAALQLRTADGLMVPHGFIFDMPYTDLNTDRWVILASADNTAIGDELTMDDLSTSPWVFTFQSRPGYTSGPRQMQLRGIEPDVVCIVEGFLSLPSFIVGTNRLGMIQGHLAEFALRHPGLRVLEQPSPSNPIVNALWWHPIHRHDPGHIWLRELFSEAGAMVAAG